MLSALFQACVEQMGSASYEDVKKTNAVETQRILVTRVLAKNLTGWEVMEILAGSVSQSDVIFGVCVLLHPLANSLIDLYDRSSQRLLILS